MADGRADADDFCFHVFKNALHTAVLRHAIFHKIRMKNGTQRIS